MAEENRIFIEVELDQAAAQRKAVELTKTITKQREELKKYRKALKDSGGENTEAAAKVEELSRSIKGNSQELRGYQKEANATSNSTEALRIETSRLAKEQAKLDTSTEQGRKEFEKLEKQLKANREQTNENAKAAGSFKDNIGNYANSIQEAIGLNMDFVGGLGDMAKGFKNAKSASDLLKIAIASTGIGAIILLLSSFFTTTREGRQIIQRFGAVFQAVFAQIGQVAKRVFGGLGTFFQDFGKNVKEFFENPLENSKELVSDLGQAILDNLTNRLLGFVESVKIVGTALKQVFELEFANAIETAKGLRTTVTQTFTGASKESIENFGQSVKDLGNEFADAAKQADNLAQANIALARVVRLQNEESANQQRIAEENRKLRDDDTKSLSERLALNQKVLEAEKARRDAQLASINAQKQIIENEIAIAGGEATEAQLDQLSQFRTELLLIEEDFAGRTAEVLTEKNAIRREALQAQANLEKAILEEKLITEALLEEEALERKLEILAKEKQAELVGLKDGSIERQQIIQEFRNRELELRKEYQEKVKEQEEQEREAQKERLQMQFEALEEQRQKELQAEAEAAAKRKAIAEAQIQVQDLRLDAAKSVTQGIINLFGEESVAGKLAFLADKAIAIAEVIINTQRANALLTAQLGVLAPPAITANTIRGAVQVATIAAQTVSGFASGGYVDSVSGEQAPDRSFAKGGYTGSGNARKPAGVVHGGEVVISKPVVQRLGGAGNVSALTGQPLGGFANGGMVGMTASRNVNQSTLSNQLETAIARMPAPVVSVEDFTTVQRRVNVVDSKINS